MLRRVSFLTTTVIEEAFLLHEGGWTRPKEMLQASFESGRVVVSSFPLSNPNGRIIGGLDSHPTLQQGTGPFLGGSHPSREGESACPNRFLNLTFCWE
jgi:hypothetical protein